MSQVQQPHAYLVKRTIKPCCTGTFLIFFVWGKNDKKIIVAD